MPDLKKRALAGILGLALALTVVACGPNDDPTNTTAPGDSSTSEPVGS